MPILRPIRGAFTGGLLALLLACGGGGGDGGGGALPPLSYSGNTNAAVVTTTNASGLVSGIFGSSSTADAVAGISTSGQAGVQVLDAGQIERGRSLARSGRDLLQQSMRAAGGTRPLVAVQVDESQMCSGGGSVRVFGTLSDTTGTGTLTTQYNSCTEDGETINGQGSFRVDAVDFGQFPPVPSDFTISFPRLQLRAAGISRDVGGSLRVQLAGLAETLTQNLVTLNNLTGRMTRTDNFVAVTTYDNLSSPTSISSTFAGRYFDSVHGFVVVTTSAPLTNTSLTEDFPRGGQLVLSGNANGKVRVSALSTNLAAIELDLNGDDVYDPSVTLRWTQMAGPASADLGDTDGDGMHNSWETTFGLIPAINDASGDDDADGFTNLAEYLGGGDPKSAGSIPDLVVGMTIQVAGAVSTPSSDTDKPGKVGIGSDGNGFLLAYCRDLGVPTGIVGVTMSASGAVTGSFPIFDTTCPQRPAVAHDGGNYLVVFSHGGSIVGTRVTPAGSILDGPTGIAISSTGTSNFGAAVAFDGANYLVVWMKFVGIAYQIYGATVTPGGVASSEFVISNGAYDVFPAIAFDGTNFMAVWTRDNKDVYAARVSTAGTVLDATAVAIATLDGFQTASGIAFDGTNYLVVWDDIQTVGIFPPPEGKVYGRRIAVDGTLLDGAANTQGIPISTGAFANHSSSVAFAGSHYLVAWAVGSFPNFPPAGIYATRLARSGARLDGTPDQLGVSVSGMPSATSRFVYPVAASNGQRALIAWADNNESVVGQKNVLATPAFGF
jgi:hypothetical protein